MRGGGETVKIVMIKEAARAFYSDLNVVLTTTRPVE